MDNSFVLNLNQNEQDITSNGTTTKQKGEFIIKGEAQKITPPAGSSSPETYTVKITLPEDMFDFAANELGVSATDLTVLYNAEHGRNDLFLDFAEGEGGPK